MASVRLGQLLFYDPILSGNRNISCASCHHPRFGTSDGLSLSIGEGGIGLGPDRRPDPHNMPEQLIPRNAPALWNLGSTEFTVMFHDGRLEEHPNFPSGIRTPLGEDMVAGFDDALAAQAMFPVLSPDEMAGHYSENEISKSVRLGQLSTPGGAWDQISLRVSDNPVYRQMFDDVLGVGAAITFAEIGNALADFIRFEWRADQSPFDLWMRGGPALSPAAEVGAALFYGKAKCASCHSGWFQTDHQFHAIGIPQFGPGKAARFEGHNRDDGRLRVTGDMADAYSFRTPSLRNVTLSAPYGHTGAYKTLKGVIEHHLDPITALADFDRSQVRLPELPGNAPWVLADTEGWHALQDRAVGVGGSLTAQDMDSLLAFLASLTDEAAAKGRLGIPDQVPSGLRVEP